MIPDLFPEPLPGISEAFMEEAQAAIRDYCEWHIAPTYTEDLVIDGPGTNVIMLPTLHVQAVNSVVVDGESVTIGPNDWSAFGAIELPSCGRYNKRRSIKINFTHGYEEAPLVLKGVVRRLQRLDAYVVGSAATSGVSFSITRTELGQDPAVASVLDRLRTGQRV